MYRKIHLLQNRLLSSACKRSLLGLSLLQDGHILSFSGMSRDEMLLVYNFLKVTAGVQGVKLVRFAPSMLKAVMHNNGHITWH